MEFERIFFSARCRFHFPGHLPENELCNVQIQILTISMDPSPAAGHHAPFSFCPVDPRHATDFPVHSRTFHSPHFDFGCSMNTRKMSLHQQSFIGHLSHEERPTEQPTPPHRGNLTYANLWYNVRLGLIHLTWMQWYHGINMKDAVWDMESTSTTWKGTYEHSYVTFARRARRNTTVQIQTWDVHYQDACDYSYVIFAQWARK